MSDEIVKYSNQFNAQALRKFTALDLDLLMAIASRVRDKGTDEVVVAFEELRRLSGLQKNLTTVELEDRIIQVNSRLLALNFMFKDGRKTIQFPPVRRLRDRPGQLHAAGGSELALLVPAQRPHLAVHSLRTGRVHSLALQLR